jgi:glycogen(starch) synthase
MNDPRTLAVLATGNAWFTEQAGGMERYFAGLMARAAGAGLDCRGLVTGSPAVAASSGGRVTAYAPTKALLLSRLWAARRAVAAAVADRPVDLWASHFALYAYPVLRQLRRLPHVVHFHGPWADEGAREGEWSPTVFVKRQIERRVYHSADRLIVLSDAFRGVLCDTYAVDPARVIVIPGGVDVDRFDIPTTRAEAREQLGWPADRRVVLCVRRLVRRMGLHLLLDAVEQLRGRHPDLLCLIAGKGPLTDELAAAIAARDLGGHVRLLGFVPDERLPLAYRAADLSVVPTEAFEGFGLITIESLAAGTPTLVTPVGGLPEVVRPLSPALVTGAATAAALTERLGDWLSGAMAVPTAAQCLSYARTGYDWPTVARRVADVYRAAV